MTEPAPAPSGATPRTRREMRRVWEHSELAPVSARPPFIEYLHQLWDRRHFIRVHAFSQAMGQHQGTLLGNAWLILAPLLDGLVYWFIFGFVFHARTGVPDFLPRLIIGILLFSFVSRALSSCAASVNAGRALLRAFSFPRASLPLAAVTREAYSQIPSFVAMLMMILIVPPHARVGATWLLAPLPLVLITGVGAGVGLMLARLANAVPDVTKLIPYAMRLMLYGSGVVFGIDRFSDHATLQTVLRLNPVQVFLEMTRDLLLYHAIPPASDWLQLLAWSVGTFAVGLGLFWHGEVNYGRQRTT